MRLWQYYDGAGGRWIEIKPVRTVRGRFLRFLEGTWRIWSKPWQHPEEPYVTLVTAIRVEWAIWFH